MRESDSTLILWDYCAERRVRNNNLTAMKLFQLQGQNTQWQPLGQREISQISATSMVLMVLFDGPRGVVPHAKKSLGKVLGPAKNCGNGMAQWILKSNSQIFPRRSLRHLRTEEVNTNLVEERKHLAFMENIRINTGQSMSLPIKTFSEDEVEYNPYES